MTKITMRDSILQRVHASMVSDPSIVVLTADLGAPSLDAIRRDFPDRFCNVGIAEQNLINVSTGFALEGFKVFALAIAPFLSMRAYEQIRNNLSLLSQTRSLNVNLLGVGSGFSYEVSGPTHHGLEDLSIIRTLPHVALFSPSDYKMAAAFVPYALAHDTPKYFRLDGKPLPPVYDGDVFDFAQGFNQLIRGTRVCLVSTGYMTQQVVPLVRSCPEWTDQVGVIDLFMLQPLNEEALFESLASYDHVIVIEEAFTGKGGLDSVISRMLATHSNAPSMTAMGLPNHYLFDMGTRTQLHGLCGLSDESIRAVVRDRL